MVTQRELDVALLQAQHGYHVIHSSRSPDNIDFLHLTGNATAILQRLTERSDADLPSQSDLRLLRAVYQRVFDILRPHAPVIDININDTTPPPPSDLHRPHKDHQDQSR